MLFWICLFYPRPIHELEDNDIGYIISTGENVLEQRIGALTRTWFQFIPEVHVYSERINETLVKKIISQNNHVNIIFHELNIISHALIGSQRADQKEMTQWNMAQHRHIPYIVDGIKFMPQKKWYMLLDDDTFLLPDSIPLFLTAHINEKDSIYGLMWAPFIELNRFFLKENEFHVMAQGGAGVFISAPILQNISSFLLQCNDQITGFNFPSDIRLSICLERFYGNSIFHHYHYIEDNLIHGDRVEKSFPRHSIDNWTITFHHISPKNTDQLFNASTSRWTDNFNHDRYISWSHIAFSEEIFELEAGKVLRMIWGYKLYFDQTEFATTLEYMKRDYNNQKQKNIISIVAISQLESIFEENNHEKIQPIRFVQHYSGNITLFFNCDPLVGLGQIEFDHSELFDLFYFNVQCQKSQLYRINHNGTSSPLIIHRNPPSEPY